MGDSWGSKSSHTDNVEEARFELRPTSFLGSLKPLLYPGEEDSHSITMQLSGSSPVSYRLQEPPHWQAGSLTVASLPCCGCDQTADKGGVREFLLPA